MLQSLCLAVAAVALLLPAAPTAAFRAPCADAVADAGTPCVTATFTDCSATLPFGFTNNAWLGNNCTVPIAEFEACVNASSFDPQNATAAQECQVAFSQSVTATFCGRMSDFCVTNSAAGEDYVEACTRVLSARNVTGSVVAALCVQAQFPVAGSAPGTDTCRFGAYCGITFAQILGGDASQVECRTAAPAAGAQCFADDMCGQGLACDGTTFTCAPTGAETQWPGQVCADDSDCIFGSCNGTFGGELVCDYIADGQNCTFGTFDSCNVQTSRCDGASGQCTTALIPEGSPCSYPWLDECERSTSCQPASYSAAGQAASYTCQRGFREQGSPCSLANAANVFSECDTGLICTPTALVNFPSPPGSQFVGTCEPQMSQPTGDVCFGGVAQYCEPSQGCFINNTAAGMGLYPFECAPFPANFPQSCTSPSFNNFAANANCDAERQRLAQCVIDSGCRNLSRYNYYQMYRDWVLTDARMISAAPSIAFFATDFARESCTFNNCLNEYSCFASCTDVNVINNWERQVDPSIPYPTCVPPVTTGVATTGVATTGVATTGAATTGAATTGVAGNGTAGNLTTTGGATNNSSPAPPSSPSPSSPAPAPGAVSAAPPARATSSLLQLVVLLLVGLVAVNF